MKQQTQTNQIEWQEVELGKISEITSSKRIYENEYVNEGIPFYRSKEIIELSRGLEISIELFISNKRYGELKNQFGIPKKGDLLITAVGTIGKSYVIPNNNEFYFKDGNLLWLRKLSNINPIYLNYFLSNHFNKNKNDLSSGSAYGALTIVKLKKLKIPLPFSNNKPDLKEQERIISILEKAEKLKEKSKEANDLLDEYLKSVFNEMFYNKGLDLKKGRELFELAYGKGLSGEQRDGGKYPVYGSNGIVGNHSEFLVKSPGIIVGRKGSIGEVNFAKENFWPIDTTYYVKPLKEINFIYLYYLLKSHNLKMNNSTAIPGLNRNDVYIINFVDPPLPLQQKFAKIVEQIEKMKEDVKKTKQNSEQLFNSLMTKAFRGELK